MEQLTLSKHGNPVAHVSCQSFLALSLDLENLEHTSTSSLEAVEAPSSTFLLLLVKVWPIYADLELSATLNAPRTLPGLLCALSLCSPVDPCRQGRPNLPMYPKCKTESQFFISAQGGKRMSYYSCSHGYGLLPRRRCSLPLRTHDTEASLDGGQEPVLYTNTQYAPYTWRGSARQADGGAAAQAYRPKRHMERYLLRAVIPANNLRAKF